MGRGNYYRWNAKIATGDLLSLDLACLKQLGCISPWIGFSLTWKNWGREIGSITIDLMEDSITFRFKTTSHGGQSIPVCVNVAFSFTPCHFGGQRKWFMCRCGRSVSRLFIQGQQVACRHCLKLAYSSQREDRLDRLNRKIDKKQSKLKDERCRPKGMHWKTFQKKSDELNRLESLKWQVFELECTRRFPGMEF